MKISPWEIYHSISCAYADLMFDEKKITSFVRASPEFSEWLSRYDDKMRELNKKGR